MTDQELLSKINEMLEKDYTALEEIPTAELLLVQITLLFESMKTSECAIFGEAPLTEALTKAWRGDVS